MLPFYGSKFPVHPFSTDVRLDPSTEIRVGLDPQGPHGRGYAEEGKDTRVT